MVRRLAGEVYYEKLAKMVGSSRSNLMRWARDNGVSLDALSYKPEIVEAVCRFYELHGKVKTQKAFPNVRVRSIVEKYKDFSPRQIRWAGPQLVEAVKMAGLVSPSAQAKYFRRPRAFSGSIKSLWSKKFGFRGGSINGMVHWYARELVNHKARYLSPMGESRHGRPVKFRRLILWVDMEKCLKPGVPDFMKDAIKTMADFQRWVWRDENPRMKIIKMMKEREV